MSAAGEGIGVARANRDAGLDRYYDSMFRDREAIFPQALELDFWRDHFILRACRDSGVVTGRVVDLGCGTGEVDVLVAEQIPGVTSVLGLDISDLGLAYAQRHRDAAAAGVRDRVSFGKADISATGLSAGSADAVILSHTLEHLPNPAPVLREIGRLLTPDGRALVVVPHEHHHDDPDHQRHLDLDGWLSLLRRYAGVERSWSSEEGDQLAFVVRPRPAASLVAMLRVRDEEQHVGALLDHLTGWVDSAVVLDDRSTDSTAQICAEHPLVASVERNDEPTDEARDKNRLLATALSTGAEWVLALDADERIEPGGEALLRRLVDSAPPWVDALTLDCLHLWDAPDQARFDGAYGRDIRHPRLFRTEAVRETGDVFAATAHGGGFHCGSVPTGLRDRAVPTPVRFLHFGYLDADVRRRKAAYYEREDAEFHAAGSYDHILSPPTVLVPVVDRRVLLEQHEWTWSGLESPATSAHPAAQGDVVIVDGRLPDAELRSIQQTRAAYRIQVGGRPTVWTDLRVNTAAEARALAPPDAGLIGLTPERKPDPVVTTDDLGGGGERCVPWADDLQMVYEHLHRYLVASRLVAGRDVLDLASGEGYGAALLRAAGARRVVGLDIDRAAVEHANRTYPGVEFRVGSICDPDAVEAGEFDVVTCFEAIEHVTDQIGLRKLMTSALRPGGVVLVSTPDTDVYTGQLHQDNEFHVAELDLDGFRSWLEGGWANVALLRQSLVVGSVVEPLDGSGADGFVHEGVRKVTQSDWIVDRPATAPYLVAVASDGELPAITASLMSDVDLGAVREPMRRMYDALEDAKRARSALDRAEGWADNVASLRAQVVELADARVAAEAERDAVAAELAAARAWRAEFDRSRAGRAVSGWRAMRDRLKPPPA